MLLIGGPKQFGRKEPSMMLIGCDYHPSWQQICWFDTATGETGERKLDHATGEAEKFYRGLSAPALIGMESTGNCQWFVEMATAAGHDVWTGDAARIRACEVRAQKHDRRDAALILKLLLEGRFPRIWTPSGEEKDLRQLLIHRYKLVRIRAQVKNELQHLAMNQGITKKRKLWSKAGERVLRELPLAPWAGRRREDLFKVREMLSGQIDRLDQAVVEVAEKNEKARLLMTQPGVGPITSMAFVLTMGDVSRLQRCHTKAKGVAKVAAARKLAIRLYWMLRTNTGYPGVVRVESSSRVALVVRHGG